MCQLGGLSCCPALCLGLCIFHLYICPDVIALTVMVVNPVVTAVGGAPPGLVWIGVFLWVSFEVLFLLMLCRLVLVFSSGFYVCPVVGQLSYGVPPCWIPWRPSGWSTIILEQ